MAPRHARATVDVVFGQPRSATCCLTSTSSRAPPAAARRSSPRSIPTRRRAASTSGALRERHDRADAGLEARLRAGCRCRSGRVTRRTAASADRPRWAQARRTNSRTSSTPKCARAQWPFPTPSKRWRPTGTRPGSTTSLPRGDAHPDADTRSAPGGRCPSGTGTGRRQCLRELRGGSGGWRRPLAPW